MVRDDARLVTIAALAHLVKRCFACLAGKWWELTRMVAEVIVSSLSLHVWTNLVVVGSGLALQSVAMELCARSFIGSFGAFVFLTTAEGLALIPLLFEG